MSIGDVCGIDSQGYYYHATDAYFQHLYAVRKTAPRDFRNRKTIES
jgi:hypothetical protein